MVTSRTEIMTSQPSFQNNLTLGRSRVAKFVYIIKVATMFIETTFKDSKKLKEFEIIYQNTIDICIS